MLLRTPSPYFDRALEEPIRLGCEAKGKAAGVNSSGLFNSWLPTVDNLRNWLLTPTIEILTFSTVERRVTGHTAPIRIVADDKEKN